MSIQYIGIGDPIRSTNSVLVLFFLRCFRFQWPITNISELHEAIRSYCLTALPECDCDAVACQAISTLFLMSVDSQIPSFVDVILEIVRRKIELLDENLVAVYNKNHVKHFRNLPWWFKSSVLLDYISVRESEACKETNESWIEEPAPKKQRVELEDIEIDEESFYRPDDTLAEFCKETKEQVITVHEMCKKLDTEMEKQKIRNKEFNELIERALLDEDVNISGIRYSGV